MSARTKYGK